MEAWLLIAIVGTCTIALKALGPLVIGGRALPRPVLGIVALLAPTLLAALIVTQAFADGRHLVVDARAAGLGAALIAVALRAPVLVVVVLAAAVAALTRAVA
jgi:Branched-chain amino acid transport protein (AzlD)